MRKKLEGFASGYATVEETMTAIHKVYTESGYVMDTHTAVAASVFDKYLDTNTDTTTTVIVSTASPYKFAESVLSAVGIKSVPEGDYEQAIMLREISGIQIPDAMEEIHFAEIRHDKVCETDKMKAKVEELLKII